MADNMENGEGSESIPLLDLVRRDILERDSMDTVEGDVYDLRAEMYVQIPPSKYLSRDAFES